MVWPRPIDESAGPAATPRTPITEVVPIFSAFNVVNGARKLMEEIIEEKVELEAIVRYRGCFAVNDSHFPAYFAAPAAEKLKVFRSEKTSDFKYAIVGVTTADAVPLLFPTVLTMVTRPPIWETSAVFR